MKTKTGVREDKTTWEKATRWFGYKLHLIVDSTHELPLGFELHTIRGMKKMKLRVTLALAVMLAMALGRIRIGQMDQLRSLTAPVLRAA